MIKFNTSDLICLKNMTGPINYRGHSFACSGIIFFNNIGQVILHVRENLLFQIMQILFRLMESMLYFIKW